MNDKRPLNHFYKSTGEAGQGKYYMEGYQRTWREKEGRLSRLLRPSWEKKSPFYAWLVHGLSFFSLLRNFSLVLSHFYLPARAVSLPPTEMSDVSFCPVCFNLLAVFSLVTYVYIYSFSSWPSLLLIHSFLLSPLFPFLYLMCWLGCIAVIWIPVWHPQHKREQPEGNRDSMSSGEVRSDNSLCDKYKAKLCLFF